MTVRQTLIGRLATVLAAGALLATVAYDAFAAPANQLDSTIAEMRRQVSQVRGLAVRSDTPVVALPRAALVERLSRELNTDEAVREFLTSQMLLEVLGAMPRGFDLRQLQVRLLEEQTLAVYDYDERTIFVVADAAASGLTGADDRLVLAHELTHSLQDQHFSLRRVIPTEPTSSDAATAARALVEGDAMLTMRIWGRQFLRPNEKRDLGDDPTPPDPVMDSAPSLVQGELLFPYDAGWVFAQLLYQDGGYGAVDQAFLNPPRSTEQILHPEKYTAGEGPVPVGIPPLEQTLGGTWKTLRTDVLGELVIRLLLEPQTGWPVAEAAAAGWGGDAYSILEDGQGRRIVAISTVWDSEADAAEMYNAYSRSVEGRFKSAAYRTIDRPSDTRWASPEYQIQVLKTGNAVRIVYAPTDALLEAVEATLSGATPGSVPAPAPPSGPPAQPSASPTAPVSPSASPEPAFSPPAPSEPDDAGDD